jgi:pilus assembly protein Flp/PilA
MLGLYLNTRNFVSDRLSREEKGATAVEYGLLVGLIAVAIVVAVTFFGGQIATMFQEAACDVQGKNYTAGTAGAAGTC